MFISAVLQMIDSSNNSFQACHNHHERCVLYTKIPHVHIVFSSYAHILALAQRTFHPCDLRGTVAQAMLVVFVTLPPHI